MTRQSSQTHLKFRALAAPIVVIIVFAAMLKEQVLALPRYSTGEEIASLVAWPAGPEAGYVTGASLTIDGGFTA